MTTISTPPELSATIDELTRSAWTLAAIATVFESGLAEALREPRTLDELAGRVDSIPRERIQRVLDVVALRGLVVVTNGTYVLAPGAMPFAMPPMRTSFVGDLRSTLMQTIAYVDGATKPSPTRGWHHSDRRLLQAQGDASAGFVGGFAHFAPMLGDLAERLAKPTARFLDVGVGVASMSIAMCRKFPQLHVVGLDTFDIPLGIARDNVARSGVGDRLELRQLAIEDLRDEEAFDLIWLPACFIAPSTIPAAIHRARAALRPGGWLLVPALSTTASESQRAVFSMVLEHWGSVTDGLTVKQQFVEAGFVEPRTVPTPSWLVMIAGQR